MVDIISNRVQEAYGSFRLPSVFGPGTDAQPNGGFSTYSMLKRFGEAGRRQRQLNVDNDRMVCGTFCPENRASSSVLMIQTSVCN